MNCPICAWSPEDANYLFISETQYWRICLAPNQSLLGRCIIPLKRHAGDLADLTEDELCEFLSIVKCLEKSLRIAFKATMFNWSCYMNRSYLQKPPNPHVHWWVVPTYMHAVMFGARTFEDSHFGNPYDHNLWLDLPKDVREKIAEKIKATLA